MKKWKTKEIKLFTYSHMVELKEIPGFQISTDTNSYAHLVTR